MFIYKITVRDTNSTGTRTKITHTEDEEEVKTFIERREYLYRVFPGRYSQAEVEYAYHKGWEPYDE